MTVNSQSQTPERSLAAIRLANAGDAPAVLAIYTPLVRHTAISFELEPPAETEMAARMEQTLLRWPWLVCDGPAGMLGYAYASQHRPRAAYQWSVDVSAYVREDARRLGAASALYTSLLALLALQGYYNAYAGIALPNPASVGFHEALGFRPVGVYRQIGYKLGRWHDVGWWQRALREHDAPVGAPTDLATARGSALWEPALATGLDRLRPEVHLVAE